MPTAHDRSEAADDLREGDAVEVVYDWDIASDAIAWSASYAGVPGLPPLSLVATGLGFAEHLAAESPSSRYEAVMSREGCDTGAGVAFKTIYGLVAAKRAKSAPVWLEDSGRWFADNDGRPSRVHGVIRVVTERYEAERQRAAAAQRDPVTGASTRAHFIEQVARHLSLSARKPSTFAVLLIGLDERQGRTDEGMRDVADRLRPQIRSYELLARHAAAKFAVLLDGCSEAQAEAAAQRFIAVLGESEGAVAANARIGAVIAPYHGRTPQALLQFAEEALEATQQPGAAPFLVYRPDMSRARSAPATGATDEIVSALNEGRIALALQPVVDAQTRAVAFYEGLVRVRRANGTLTLPSALVAAAEKNGLVSLLDRRVIELAFTLLTADRKLVLSINAAAPSLRDPDWVEQLRTACRVRPDAARRLTIELTETCVIEDLDATREILTALKPLGIKIAIDDFGSGHSSFRSLRQLPIDYLKIDGAFAQNLAGSQDDRFFIRTLIDLARNLAIPTVAEWVEDEATARILAEWGVTYLQGHLFGRPELAAMPSAGGRAAR